MRTSVIATLAAVTCLMSVHATARAAETLAAGSLFGSLAQTRAVCVFYNAGTTDVTLAQFQITDQFGTPQTLVINQCGTSPSTLTPRDTCGIAADAVGNRSYSCRVRVVPDKTNVRAVLDLRDTNQNVLSNVELR